MTKLKSSGNAAIALVGIWNVTLTVFIVATLWFARDLLVPLALSALLTFLLAPWVTRLERWIGRVAAVLIVTATILTIAAAAAWVLTHQLVDLAIRLPDYKQNIQTKLRSIRVPSGSWFKRFTETVEELRRELPGGPTSDVIPSSGASDPASAAGRGIPASSPTPVWVSSRSTPNQVIQTILAPIVGPLGTAALVLILLVFMLLKREDLRSRLIRLIGQGHISSTTRALDDASVRVTRYLIMQLIVNATYGIAVALGLSWIGLPNAILWGVCAAVLRFIPYAGPLIGAGLPIVLSLAVSAGWTMPLLTITLFVALEALSNNVMEPWLYGSSTGVSPIALLFAAVCWAWLWGPVGLVLATPMTVCLVVLGRHIPRLSFLSIVLSNEEALTPAQDFYYRLLTVGEQDEIAFVEAYVKSHSLTALYDAVIIPVITAIEIDHRLELLEDEQRDLVERSIRDIIDDFGAALPPPGKAVDPNPSEIPPQATPKGRVICIPARADRDELAGTMLGQLIQEQGLESTGATASLTSGDLVRRVVEAQADAVCISVVAPSTVLHARYLCLKLRALLPNQKILVGLWGVTENASDAARRVRDSGADSVVTTLVDAVKQVTRWFQVDRSASETEASGLKSIL